MSLADARYADEALNTLPLPAAEMKPGPDARAIRRRMAGIIVGHLSLSGNVTHDDLARAGFSADEIAAHFFAAAKLAKADRMAA